MLSLNKKFIKIYLNFSLHQFFLFHVYKIFFYSVKQLPDDIAEHLRNNQINFLFQDVHT